MGAIDWNLIRGEYISTLLDKRECNLVDLAKKHKININTLRSRKQREDWDKGYREVRDRVKKKEAMQCNAMHTIAGNCTEKKASKPSKDKALSEQGKRGQRNADSAFSDLAKSAQRTNFRHGLYAKFLPPEVKEVIDEIQGADPVDMLIMSGEMLFAQIIRAMRIMHVKNELDHSKEISRKAARVSGASEAKEVEYEIQMAWDRQANFMKAIARSMAELRAIIKSLTELADAGRANEEQELRIEKLKLEIARIDADVDIGGNDVAEMIVEAARRRANRG